MPIGAPFTESFERGFNRLRNLHITGAAMQMLLMRQECLGSDALSDRGGLYDADRDHFLHHLLKCDRFRRQITYNPDNTDLGTFIEEKIDPEGKIDEKSISMTFEGEEVPMQNGGWFDFPVALDGTNVNHPARSQLRIKGNFGLLLVAAIDRAIESWLRLPSYSQTYFITVQDSLRMYSHNQQIYQLLTKMGGTDNRVDIVNPLPSEEPKGPEDSANRGEDTQQGSNT